MGWQTDDGKHEGWDPAVWPDGWVSVGATDGSAMVVPVGPDGRVVYGTPETTRDGRTAIGWRGQCDCGWRGQLWERVADRAEHDLEARRIYDGDPRTVEGGVLDLRVYGDAPEEVQDAIREEWTAHLRPLHDLDQIRAESAAVAAAQARLAAVVHAARDAGRSWSQIGAAAGMTRQSAHERWGPRPAQDHAVTAMEPREIDIDPATITRLDGREEWVPSLRRVMQRMTVGTTPDGTPVVLSEAPSPNYPTGEGWPTLAERPRYKVWAYNSLAAAREDRDYQITRGYREEDIPEHIRDVSADSWPLA